GTANLLRRGDADLNEVERRRAGLARAAKVDHELPLTPVAVTRPTIAASWQSTIRTAVAIRGRAEGDFDAESLQLLHQHVERFRNARLRQVLALDDRFVDAAASVHVVRLDGQNLLERVCRTVRLERPHFHLSEPLAAELRLAGQWLLSDERVGSDAPGVNLV